MKKGLLGLIIVLLATASYASKTVSGTVLVSGDVPKGVLYIFAKKHGSKMPMPLAVQRIESPKFPVKFELSQANAMMKNMPFKGPFKVVARISPSGSATDKSGIEISTIAPIKLGTKNVELTLKN